MKCIIYTILAVLLNQTSSQDIFETVEAVVGYSADLPCNVTAELEDDKLNILAWYRQGSSTAFYSHDSADSTWGGVPGTANTQTICISSRDLRTETASSASASGRYRLVTGDDGLDKLQIITVRPSDAGVYQCFTDFAASPAHKTFVQLNVIAPPQHLWVNYENSTQIGHTSAGVNVSKNIGPYYVGDTVQLVCVALGGKPRASLSWWSDQRLVKDTSTVLSEVRVRSDVTFGPLSAEDHGRVITCFANNNDKTAPLSIDVIIDMFLPPELVSLRSLGRDNGRVKAGETLDLQCRVLGARPTPPVMWRLGDRQLLNMDQNTTIESSQRLVVSEVQLSMTSELDESSVTCCVPSYTRDDNKFVCAEKLQLNVQYPPVLRIVVEEDPIDNNTLVVTKGSTIRMACSFQANPAVYQLIWFHGDDLISHSKDGSEVVQPFFELVDISEADAGEYVCGATNDISSAYSDPININVTYPPYCEEESLVEYGLGENESINITCNVKANPEPTSYQWVLVNEEVNITTMKNKPQTTFDTEENVLVFERINNTTYSTLFCWGVNNVPESGNVHTACTFLVTDETKPRPPTNCKAVKNKAGDIVVQCDKGHDGGLPQKFKFIVASESDDNILSITNGDPDFMIAEPKQDNYKFVVIAFNDMGKSKKVEIEKTDVVDETAVPVMPSSAVPDITTLSLALCGGVLLLALLACGLVLCSHERASRRDLPRAHSDPPLCAYNTEESNCETYRDSEDGSECNLRRTESFRRAVARCPFKNFDVRRTSSFHSARYIDDDQVHPEIKCNDIMRYGNNCRVHSLQNISRKRDMDALCDHLVLHLPPETNYNVPRPMNTFYTMPRRARQKPAKEISDEISEITQTSDGFSLPPPPDEFGTYRAGTRIKDIPTKSTPSYPIHKRNNSLGKETTRQQYTQMSPINMVGVPTVSGAQHSLYTYPDEDHHPHHPQHPQQVTTNTNPFGDDDDST